MNFDTLAIIGNGFDLAHDLKTTYRAFVENTNSPFLDLFRKYCENEKNIETWYNFEENVNIITNMLFRKNLANVTNYEEICQMIDQFTNAFIEIHGLMIDYLKNETGDQTITKITNVEKVLTDRTFVINFNYTNTAEIYTSNIHHIHGSLVEDDILLGYDYRSEACLAQYKDIRWSKILCRESLAFRRYLRDQMMLSKDDALYKEILADYDVYIAQEHSSRGLDDNLKELKYFDLIEEVKRKSQGALQFTEVEYENIIKIVILGHGIEADQKLLSEILDKCVNLQEVVIFRYDGEGDDEFNKKAEFFLPFFRILLLIHIIEYVCIFQKSPIK